MPGHAQKIDVWEFYMELTFLSYWVRHVKTPASAASHVGDMQRSGMHANHKDSIQKILVSCTAA